MTLRAAAAVIVTALLVATSGCGGSGKQTARVLYAGSLVNLMEKQVGPAFASATGFGYQGYSAASQQIANSIESKVRAGDVFIAASTAVNDTLTGPANGGWESWYATFGSAPLVLGYSPSSKYAAQLRDGRWYDALRQPGIRIGVTDPLLDPKGELTIAALDAAQRDYHLPAGYSAAIQKKAADFPEQELLGRLQSGQLDVGFFYTSEAMPAHLHTVTLGKVHEAATYTVTVLEHAKDPRAATAFVRYLLTTARPTLTAGGIEMQAPSVSGDAAAVPASLRSLLTR
ncbi:MAG TPA: substrate-binding domain-containing protein [Mycobacteriales bacterium]|nr:substrate-binding domain-containing protein [Mycobacteriales bacterium]